MASKLAKGIGVGIKIMPKKMCRRKGYVGQDKENDLKLTGEFGIELGNGNFPFGGLLLQAIQFSMSVGCVDFRSDKQLLGFLELALPLLLLL
jgi:hypothetical protein